MMTIMITLASEWGKESKTGGERKGKQEMGRGEKERECLNAGKGEHVYFKPP